MNLIYNTITKIALSSFKAVLVMAVFAFTLGDSIAQNDCGSAIPLTVGSDCNTMTVSYNAGLTNTGGASNCGIASATKPDLWLSFVAPSTGHIAAKSFNAGGPTDMILELYGGSCGALAFIECDDDDGFGLQSHIEEDGLTPGDTYYLRLLEWGSTTTFGNVDICVIGTSADGCAGAPETAVSDGIQLVSGGGTVSLDLTADAGCTVPAGDGTVCFSVEGDFGTLTSETLTITDESANTYGPYGWNTPTIGGAGSFDLYSLCFTIPVADLGPQVADGALTLDFTTTSTVNPAGFLTASMQFCCAGGGGTFCGLICPPDTLFYDLDPFECDVVVNYYTQAIGDCGFVTACGLDDPEADRQSPASGSIFGIRCGTAPDPDRFGRAYQVPDDACVPHVVYGIEHGVNTGGGQFTARLHILPAPFPGGGGCAFGAPTFPAFSAADLIEVASSGLLTAPAGFDYFNEVFFTTPVTLAAGTVYFVEIEWADDTQFWQGYAPGTGTDNWYFLCSAVVVGQTDFFRMCPNYAQILVAPIVAQTANVRVPAFPQLVEGLPTGSRFPVGCTFQKAVLLADNPMGGPQLRIDSCEFEVCVTEYPGPASMACNSGVQVSLDPTCSAEILPDMILEGSYGCVDKFEVTVFDGPDPFFANPLPTSPIIGFDQIGQTLAVMVLNTDTNTSCWGTINVEDKTPPAIVCPPDFDLTCDSVSWFLAATPTPSGAASATGAALPVAIADDGTAASVSLAIGGFSNKSKIQDVNVQVNINHSDLGDLTVTLTSPAGTTLTLFAGACGAGNHAEVYFDDQAPGAFGCQPNGDMQPQNPLSVFNGEAGVGDWTLTVTDGGAGNGLIQYIHGYWIDIQYATLSTTPIVTEACCLDNVWYEDEVDVDVCGEGEIIRTWYAVDCYKNENSCQQTITVIPNDRPTITPPLDIVHDCGLAADQLLPTDLENGIGAPDWREANSGQPLFSPTLYARPTVPPNNYCGQIAFNYEDNLFDVCLPYGFKIRRTWTALDWCDPDWSWTYVQTIKVTDEEVPVVTCPNDITLSTTHSSCTSQLIPGTVTATDNCDPNAQVVRREFLNADDVVIAVSPPDPFPFVGVGIWKIKYVVEDACSNEAACIQTVTVKDNIPPVAICDANTQISLTPQPSANGQGWADLYWDVVNDWSYDNCGPIDIRIEAVTGGQTSQNHDYVRYLCFDTGYQIVKLTVWDDGNGNGIPGWFDDLNENGFQGDGDPTNDDNYNTCWANVLVEDKLPPGIQCPVDVTVACDIDFTDPANTGGFATGITTCGQADIDWSDSGLTSCTGTFRRTWTASKEVSTHNGTQILTATCYQNITVYDDTPAAVEFPEDITLNCDAIGTEPNDLAQYNYTDADGNYHFFDLPALVYDCEQLGVSRDDEFFDICLPAGYKIKRTWHIIDWCNPNFDLTAEQIIKVTDTGTPDILVNGATGPDTNDPTSPASHSVFASIDNNDPGCQVWVDIVATAKDDCSAISISNNSPYSDNGPAYDASGFYPKGNHVFTFYAVDECGNFREENVTITVVDGKSPQAVCLQLNVELKNGPGPDEGTVTVTPQMLDGGSFDNCTATANLTFQLELTDADDSAPLGTNAGDDIVFTCDEANTLQYVRLWVFDASNNGDYCVTTIFVEDNFGVCGNTATVAGLLQTADGEDIDKVDIYMNGNMVIQNAQGGFNHPLPVGQMVTVEAEKDIELLNGVSTIDIIYIRRHILGAEPFGTNGYKWLAADINNDEKVSTIDIVHLRKAILTLSDEFPNNTSWRFLDKNHVFSTNEPLKENFKEFVEGMLTPAGLTANLVGLKVGDLNGDANPNELVGSQTRNAGNLVFGVNDASIANGETYTIDFQAKDFAAIMGYQFTLEFDATVIEFAGLEAGVLDITEDNFGLTGVQQGIITTSWDELSGMSLEDETVLFSLTFNGVSNGQLSKVLTATSRYTKAEAYSLDGSFMDVSLSFNTDNGVINTSKEFALYQNTPNPFSGTSVIGFTLPGAANATVTVYDVSGKVVKQYVGDFAKGYNEVLIQSSDLSSTGVLYYELVSADYKATKKMIIIE